MTDRNLDDFEHKIVIRQLTLADFDDLIAMSERCFPGMKPWTRAHIASQIEHFPEGQFAIEIDGRLVASAGALVVDFAEHEDWHNWKLISDNGFIRNHSLDGDTLYGIEMMVDPEFQGMRLSRRLYEARKRLVRRRRKPEQSMSSTSSTSDSNPTR